MFAATLSSILPFPLHPAVVHLPIALTLLLPPFAVGALWAIHRGAAPRRAWGIATALFAALSLSAWLAVETGEQADEQVERVVAEQPIESHEEAARVFLALSAGVLGIAVAGLARGRVGRTARVVSTAGTVALLGAGWRVGHSGGALVYQHGAASAYTNRPDPTVARAGSADRARAPHATTREWADDR